VSEVGVYDAGCEPELDADDRIVHKPPSSILPPLFFTPSFSSFFLDPFLLGMGGDLAQTLGGRIKKFRGPNSRMTFLAVSTGNYVVLLFM